MSQYRIDLATPENWKRPRWCLLRDGRILFHRDTRELLVETVRLLMKEKTLPAPEWLTPESWEAAVSLPDLMSLRRAGFDLRQE